MHLSQIGLQTVRINCSTRRTPGADLWRLPMVVIAIEAELRVGAMLRIDPAIASQYVLLQQPHPLTVAVIKVEAEMDFGTEFCMRLAMSLSLRHQK
jgi:hypothetical protein